MSTGFVIAEKKLAKAKVALMGPSGSGKTLGALKLARGLTNNGRVGVLDSENNSASLYSDKFGDWKYLTLPIAPPYTARKYADVIDLAAREKLDCLIIDSYSHVWAGEGGLLQQKEALDSRAGSNSYTNWGQITKLHEALKSKLLYSPIHIIVTMRSKQEYIMEANERGKMAPKKVGTKPIQRDDLEYEFTVAFDIGMDHQFLVSKDRTDLFDGAVGKLSEQTGADISAWLCNDISTPDLASEAPTEAAKIAQPAATAPPPTKPVIRPRVVPNVAQQQTTPANDMAGPEPDPMMQDQQEADRQAAALSNAEMAALKNPRTGNIAVHKIVDAQDRKANAQAKAPPPQEIDVANYVIKCGQNWGMVGKKIIEVNESTLVAALRQANNLIDKGNRDANVVEFVKYACQFLKDMGVAL